MAEKEIAKRVREMAAYVDEEHIAKAVGLKVEVVRGIIRGEIDDGDIGEYDYEKPPDVRIVEKRRYVRSKVVGAVSPGGCGATTLLASLAVLSAAQTGLPVVAVDLNEFASLGVPLGIDVAGENAVKYPNVLWWAEQVDVEEIAVQYPDVENLNVIIGAATAQRHMEMKPETAAALIRSLAKKYYLTWVDCPTHPAFWPEIVPEMDIFIFVLRTDRVSANYLWQVLPVLREKDLLDRCSVVMNLTGGKGWSNEVECRKEAKKLGVPVLASLPEEPDLRQRSVLDCLRTPYGESVREFLNEICPEKVEKKKGFFDALKGIFVGR